MKRPENFKGADFVVHEVQQFIVRRPPGMGSVGGAWPAMNGRASCTMKSAPLK